MGQANRGVLDYMLAIPPPVPNGMVTSGPNPAVKRFQRDTYRAHLLARQDKMQASRSLQTLKASQEEVTAEVKKAESLTAELEKKVFEKYMPHSVITHFFEKNNDT